ncbi:MAG TPA: ABC transporter ATP-binding protein [Bradyrhizobium sp.]
MADSKQPVLEVRNLSVALPKGGDRVHAVEKVSFTVNPGEIVCLVGESGSGKSVIAFTVMGLLAKALKPTAGEILLEGENILAAGEARLRELRCTRMSMIFQEPMTALNPVMTCGQQIDEVLNTHTQLDAATRKAKIIAILARVKLPEPERIYASYPHQLSGGQRQRIMIAMALVLEPVLLIADEPTTALDVTTQAQILYLIRELQREHGTSVLFITHDFGVVADIADEVAVLQRGTLVERGTAAAVLGAPGHPYTRALIAAVPKLVPPAARPANTQPFIVEARDVAKTYGTRGLFGGRVTLALAGVTMELRRGETLGLVGESGSGKSTLARAITRLLPIDGGEILLGGVDIAQLSRRQLRPVRKRVQMVFQDPYASLDPRQRIIDIIAEGPIIHGTPPAKAREEAHALLGLVGLDPSAARRFPHEFSGGQRQRIGIARALALHPEVLVADEPVSALDVSVQAQVLALLADIKARLHLSMLFVTHDLRVALQVCDRIAVMKQGEVVEVAPTAEIFFNPQHSYTKALFAAVPGGTWQDRKAS